MIVPACVAGRGAYKYCWPHARAVASQLGRPLQVTGIEGCQDCRVEVPKCPHQRARLTRQGLHNMTHALIICYKSIMYSSMLAKNATINKFSVQVSTDCKSANAVAIRQGLLRR